MKATPLLLDRLQELYDGCPDGGRCADCRKAAQLLIGSRQRAEAERVIRPRRKAVAS